VIDNGTGEGRSRNICVVRERSLAAGLEKRAAGIFASRSFRMFYAGQAFSYVGDGLRTLALPLLVFHLTGSALSLGITYALEFLPFAVTGLVGGSLADRLDRRRLLLACDFVRFFVIALFAVAYWRGFLTLPMLYVGIVVISMCAAIFLGAQAPSIPYMVGKARTTQGVAALVATEQAANMIAPSAGGALYGLGGPLPSLVVNALTYLASLASLIFIPTLGPDQRKRPPGMRDLANDISVGFRFMLADVPMRTITLMSLGLNLFGMMATAVYIPFMKRDFGAADATIGVALGIGASGAILGSLVAGKFSSRWPFGRALCWAYLIDGVIYLPVMFAHHIWIVVLFWTLANSVATFEMTQIVSWRLRVIPEEQIGRVFGAVRLVALIGVVPGTIVGGYLADAFGARLPVVVSGVAYLLLALLAFLVPQLRRDSR